LSANHHHHHHHSLLGLKAAQEKLKHTIKASNKKRQINKQTSRPISANADGPRDPASRKIDHIARPTKYNYQATSVG